MNDTKNEVLYKLNTLLGVLNNITVSGEQNCDNISGSIKMVRELCGIINKCEFEAKDKKSISERKSVKEE